MSFVLTIRDYRWTGCSMKTGRFFCKYATFYDLSNMLPRRLKGTMQLWTRFSKPWISYLLSLRSDEISIQATNTWLHVLIWAGQSSTITTLGQNNHLSMLLQLCSTRDGNGHTFRSIQGGKPPGSRWRK